MEKEINILKKEYQSITPPSKLLENGADDLWKRVDENKPFFNLYFPRIILVAGILLLIFSGFISISFAYQKSGTVFYQFKKFTQNTLNSLSKTPIVQFYNSKIQQPTPTPIKSGPRRSPKPIEGIIPSIVQENNSKKENNSNDSKNQNQNLQQNIKGASSNFSDNSHGKINNQDNNQSQNHSNVNYDNNQNENKEKGNNSKK